MSGESPADQNEPAAEWADTTSLLPNPRNAELRDNASAVPMVMASIAELGFGAPLVARRSNRMLIAGHTRLEAARRLELPRVPVRFLDIDQDRADLLMLADNRLGEKATWRDAGLRAASERFGPNAMALAGWSADEVATWKPIEPIGGWPSMTGQLSHAITFYFTEDEKRDVTAAIEQAVAASGKTGTAQRGTVLAEMARVWLAAHDNVPPAT